jgi:hypothetical protein
MKKMTKEYDNVLEAKRTVKKLITFLETLLENLKKPDKTFRGYAVVTAWCIDRYFSEKISPEIQQVIEKNSTPPGQSPS